jgi:uncharacterized protein (TIGR02001 family)
MDKETRKFRGVGLALLVTWAVWGAHAAWAEEVKPEEAKKVEEAQAKATEEKVQFTFGADILSQYVFRGIALSRDSAVIQPTFTVSYKGLALNIWGNFDTNEKNPFGINSPNRNNPKWNETDFTLSYTREIFKNFNLTGGMIYYALDSNNSPHDSFEIYGGFGYKFPWFEVGFAAYREVAHFPGWYLSWYITRSFDLPFAGATLDLWASWGAELSNDKAAFPTKDGGFYRSLNAGHLMATVNFPVGKHVKISPKIMYWYGLGGESTYTLRSLSWDRNQNHILGGVSVTANF